MAVLLIKMAGVRKTQPTIRPNQELLWEVKKAA
jgi:hypothetical protein